MLIIMLCFICSESKIWSTIVVYYGVTWRTHLESKIKKTKKFHPEKNSYISGKWNFLALRLTNFIYFQRNDFLYFGKHNFSGNKTF